MQCYYNGSIYFITTGIVVAVLSSMGKVGGGHYMYMCSEDSSSFRLYVIAIQM